MCIKLRLARVFEILKEHSKPKMRLGKNGSICTIRLLKSILSTYKAINDLNNA